ncbi:hypothetical protein DL766_009063 [Monosporascus sp. MC13-8B]|uniref:HypA protein n=1 Tax=Monosporascus cannonballus TaxID=155416 RepID=A0ABY0GQ08_9PEZI|nr:hypothetical protein DL762_010349 [Monosporascus cannonballus]RYO89585.1 hypothetical protein DL763_005613 [Monosporascus cannonballus]RYP16687.1 hypothetical protein DL766_009063 [Monosporascus sp. MC13-8B]
MATASKIQITPENTGLWHIKQSEPAAKKATELLQKDLERHHVFFNNNGFHNHISHHILALYGTGASPESLEKGYKVNEGYQRPAAPPHEELRDWAEIKQYLGKEERYADFLAFFEGEIERLGGWEAVLREYLFKPGDERSEDLLVRMFAGLLHPLMQLMYGVEWRQPAVVAMALAQAAVHGDRGGMRDFLLTTDRQARAASSSEPMPAIVDLLEAARADEKLARSARLSDGNKTREGMLDRAWGEATAVASRVRVNPDELDERTAEMYHAAVYAGASAALRPGKEPKWDFFMIPEAACEIECVGKHHINVCPIFLVINAQDWIPLESKVRILEWKIRLDLGQYTARACPELLLDRIASYEPKDKGPGPAIDRLLPRIHAFEDDGHTSKLFRAVEVGRRAISRYENDNNNKSCWVLIRGPELWDKIMHLTVDSVEAPGPNWVRGAGDAEAWKGEQDRDGRPAGDEERGIARAEHVEGVARPIEAIEMDKFPPVQASATQDTGREARMDPD